MLHHPGSAAALMPGADDRALRLVTGQHVDTRAPWPFPELTPAQQAERDAFVALRDRGALRGLPSCFGDLS